MEKFRKALFIFRRDLRIEDNTGLNFALKNSESVLPAFIFTPTQIENNPYLGKHSLQFMIESLEDLDGALKNKQAKLTLFYGQPEAIIDKCIRKLGVDAVIVNRDYTPYSLKRDESILNLCQNFKIPFLSFHDALLHPPEQTLKADGKPYTVFTPYHRNAIEWDVPFPASNSHKNYDHEKIPFAESTDLYQRILPVRELPHFGGRNNALEILKSLKRFVHYPIDRNLPALDGTTKLSAHLKFTTCSIREAYYAIANQLGSESELIRALYWRDFFTSIAFYFPYVFSGSFHKKYDKLKWTNNKEAFKQWCEGLTGFPIVDAGMRELNQTGFMHNRVRMIAASFLVKDLRIDWRWGEKYFAQQLIDYDPAVNNGNWQWAASTGCDAQPYFRIFNPWLQAKKFDPDCLYIKRWVPELVSQTPTSIHQWYLEKFRPENIDYPSPIVDHSKETKKTLELYKSV